MMTDPAILFVCLGNICRSPLAEAAFRAEAEKAGLSCRIDSAGTGDWHVGGPPDDRARDTARRHGLDISGYRARQVTDADFHDFTHIFALDVDNLRNLRAIAPEHHGAHLGLLLDLLPDRQEQGVKDPYYGGPEGFEAVWQDVVKAAKALVNRLG